jgi:hypothetical protein
MSIIDSIKSGAGNIISGIGTSFNQAVIPSGLGSLSSALSNATGQLLGGLTNNLLSKIQDKILPRRDPAMDSISRIFQNLGAAPQPRQAPSTPKAESGFKLSQIQITGIGAALLIGLFLMKK